MRVGWIGMGQIGRPMAARVLRAGHSLHGHARAPERFDDLRSAGAVVTSSVKDAVADAEVVCINVFSEEQLIQALVREGALAAMRKDAVLVIHSTVSPSAVKEIAAARPEIDVIDAAFSASVADVITGRVTLMVGGDVAALARIRPILSAYSEEIIRVGSLGCGMSVKLVNNLLFAAQTLLARDAVRLLHEAGVSIEDAVGAVLRSSGGSYAMELFASADPEKVLADIRPYLVKDVGQAAIAVGGSELGTLTIAAEHWTA